MKLLIDCDSAMYKAGCSNETRWYNIFTRDGFLVHQCQYKAQAQEYVGEDDLMIVPAKEAGPLSHSIQNVKRLCEFILDKYPGHEYEFFLEGKGNFRDDIYPDYKGHRDATSKPIHLPEIKDYLMNKWGAVEVLGEETDDRVSWLQCTADYPTCIVSVDKDLNNTPGPHYNYSKDEYYVLTEQEADFNFARQLLTGDPTDNIKGLPGVGKVAAKRILPEYVPNWMEIVHNEYKERGFDDEYLTLQGRLLWMRREPNQMWSIIC